MRNENIKFNIIEFKKFSSKFTGIQSHKFVIVNKKIEIQLMFFLNLKKKEKLWIFIGPRTKDNYNAITSFKDLIDKSIENK